MKFKKKNWLTISIIKLIMFLTKNIKTVVLLGYLSAVMITTHAFLYQWQLGAILYMIFGLLHVISIYNLRKDVPPDSDEFSEEVDPVLDSIETDKAYAMMFIVAQGSQWPIFIFYLLSGMKNGGVRK